MVTGFNPNRPKISLRRFTARWTLLAIQEFIINRKRLAINQMVALENVYRMIRRG